MGKHSHHKKVGHKSKYSDFFEKWGGIDNEPKFIELPDDFGETSSEEGHNGDVEDSKKSKHHSKSDRSSSKNSSDGASAKDDAQNSKGKEEHKKEHLKHAPSKTEEKNAKKQQEHAISSNLNSTKDHHLHKKDHEHPKKEHEEPKKGHEHPKKEHEEPKKGHEHPKKEHEEPKKRHDQHNLKKESEDKKKGHEHSKKEHEESTKRHEQNHHKKEHEDMKKGDEHSKKEHEESTKRHEQNHHKKEHEDMKKGDEHSKKKAEEAKKGQDHHHHKMGQEEPQKENCKKGDTNEEKRNHEHSSHGGEHTRKEEHENPKIEAHHDERKLHFQEPVDSSSTSEPKKSFNDIPDPGNSKPSDQEKLPKPQGDCEVCGHLAKLFCSACKHVFYCTKEHQKKHWKTHKEDCSSLKKLPYRVERNDTLGRHLVATMDIPAGTHFLNESPMVLGPRQLSKPICLGCHKELTDPQTTVKCSRCQWPLCSRKCEDSKTHEAECRLIKYGGSKVTVDSFGQVNMMYACITVLRALALQDGPQQVWKDYTRFESHLDKRMKTEIYTKVNKEKVVYFIHYFLKLINKFSDLEILETCGRLDTNCFEIKQNGFNLRAMYRIACIISHDCRPNTKHTFDPDHSINLYSTVNIPKGSIISASYTQTIWSTLNRREHLYMSKCFWCKCERCRDSTEFGTYLSCYNCSSCGGRVLPVDPLNNEASWSCETCSESMSVNEVKEIYNRVTSELKEVDRSDPDCLERFMLEQAPVLPDSNQLIREIQFGLVCLLKVANPEWLSHHHLLRKAFLSKELLKVANQLEPGLSKWRGQLLFEMQSSNVVLAQRALDESKITSFQAKEIFEENLNHLQEAVSILQVEPEEREKLQDQLKALSKALDAVSSVI